MPNAQLVLADYYLASGRTDKAVPLLQKMASTPARGEADLRLAELDVREGRRPQARQRVDALLEREPANARALVLQAQLLADDGKLDEAVGRLQAAVAANPGLAEAHFALGRAHVARNDRDQAIRAFNQTLRLNPRAVAAQVELSRLELSRGRPDSSIQFAEQALKNAPRNPDAQIALVRGLIARRDVRRAEGALQVLIRQFPNHAAVQAQAGILAGLKGNRADAARILTRALELDRDNLEALNALVSLDLAAKNTDSAIRRVEARLARTPQDAGALLLGAGTYAAAGNQPRAEELLRKTIEVDSSNVQAYEQLGRMYLSQRRLDEALAEFDALSKRHPRPVQAHTLAGVILEALNKPLDARRRYELALEIDPQMPVAANNLAWMYVESGENLDVALQLAQTATRRLPDNPAMQDTLGWIYYKKGLASLAVPHVRAKRQARAAQSGLPLSPGARLHEGRRPGTGPGGASGGADAGARLQRRRPRRDRCSHPSKGSARRIVVLERFRILDVVEDDAQDPLAIERLDGPVHDVVRGLSGPDDHNGHVHHPREQVRIGQEHDRRRVHDHPVEGRRSLVEDLRHPPRGQRALRIEIGTPGQQHRQAW